MSSVSIPAVAAPGHLQCDIVLATPEDQERLLSKLKAALALVQSGTWCAGLGLEGSFNHGCRLDVPALQLSWAVGQPGPPTFEVSPVAACMNAAGSPAPLHLQQPRQPQPQHRRRLLPPRSSPSPQLMWRPRCPCSLAQCLAAVPQQRPASLRLQLYCYRLHRCRQCLQRAPRQQCRRPQQCRPQRALWQRLPPLGLRARQQW